MKPILFNTEMVRAILDDRKTVTRRAIRSSQAECSAQPPKAALSARVKYRHSVDPTKTLDDFIGTSDPQLLVSCAPYKKGDVLWVRETWAKNAYGGFFYKSDGKCEVFSWHPSIHMPKEAARLFLRVTGVRVERLRDITFEQIEKEGIVPYEFISKVNRQTARKQGLIIAMMRIWNSTIKKPDLDRYGWHINPWVWAISFERIDKEQAIKEV